MCGRYRLKDPKQAFAWIEVAPSSEFLPRFNIAPSQRIPVVTAPGRLEAMTWGLAPRWVKQQSRTIINARSENIRKKRSFKSPFTHRRCLLPADGFYEWSKIGKHPYLFTVHEGAPFAIAAIWEPAEDLPRCCLLTTAANALLEPIHGRMPVIVRREDWPEWFTPGDLAGPSFERITAPYAAGEMSALAVSPQVNSARIDDPKCSEPFEPAEALKITRRQAAKPDQQQTFGF